MSQRNNTEFRNWVQHRREIHRRLPESFRSRVSQTFRNSDTVPTADVSIKLPYRYHPAWSTIQHHFIQSPGFSVKSTQGRWPTFKHFRPHFGGPRCEAGDMQAIKELANRLDGRPAQILEHSGPDSNPIEKIHAAAGRNQVDRGHAPTAARNHLRAKQWEWKRRTQFLRSRQLRLSRVNYFGSRAV